MKTQREIQAKHLVEHVQAGVSNAELMKKYRLSAKRLLSVLRKLVEAKLMEQSAHPAYVRGEATESYRGTKFSCFDELEPRA